MKLGVDNSWSGGVNHNWTASTGTSRADCEWEFHAKTLIALVTTRSFPRGLTAVAVTKNRTDWVAEAPEALFVALVH